MSVSKNIAERLLAHAKGVAVDLLFPHAVHIEQAPGAQPSRDLIVQRWSSLPAASAAVMASSVTDADTLDMIAAKEKRKTVRMELASNENLHPVTRLFYIQEAARGNDHDLLRASLKGMRPHELLGYIEAKDPVVRYARMEGVARRIVEDDDVSTLQAYAEKLDRREFTDFCGDMVQYRAVAALNLFERAGVMPKKLEISRYINVPTDNIALWKTLYSIDPENIGPQILRAFCEETDRIAEIDPALVAQLLKQRRYTIGTVRTLVANGHLDALIAEEPRLDSESSDWLLQMCDDERVRTHIIVRHPEPARSVGHIRDLTRYAAIAGDEIDTSTGLQWLTNAAETLGLQRTIEVLEGLLTSDKNRSIALRHDMLSNLAERLGCSNDQLISEIGDEPFARITTFPELQDPLPVLERAERLGRDLDLTIALCLIGHRNNEEAVQVRAAEIVIRHNRFDELGNWLARSSAEQVQPVIMRHRALIAELTAAHRELQRQPWAVTLIDSMVPKGGWGSVRSDNLLASAMDYLEAQIGPDIRVWEAVLVLFESWTGSLDELVTTARHI
jgi:hypothetical protein